jgi:GTP-binding protein LepA
MGAVMKLCLERRGINKNYQYLTNNRLEMIFELPLAEVIYDFYDRLKSVTQGYGSFDYELIDYRRHRPGEAGHSDQRRTGGRPVHAGPPGQCRGRARVACEKLKG